MANLDPALLNTILDRMVEIDKAISATVDDIGSPILLRSYPVFFNNPGAPPYPKTLHRIGLTTVVYTSGQPQVDVNVQVVKLLVAGPTGAGYVQANERIGNVFLLKLVGEYIYRPKLQHPTSTEPLRYLAAGTPVKMMPTNGIIEISFDPESDARFFGAELIFEVSLRLQQGRLS